MNDYLDLRLISLVDEGALLAAAGVRISVTNKAILRILRKGADHSDEWYLGAVRKELHAHAEENRGDAERLEKTLARARKRRGRPEHRTDFRRVDVVNLERRREVLLALANRLDEEAADETYVADLATVVYERVWAEIRQSIELRALQTGPSSVQLTDDERAEALDGLRGDIERLRDEKWDSRG